MSFKIKIQNTFILQIVYDKGQKYLNQCVKKKMSTESLYYI